MAFLCGLRTSRVIAVWEFPAVIRDPYPPLHQAFSSVAWTVLSTVSFPKGRELADRVLHVSVCSALGGLYILCSLVSSVVRRRIRIPDNSSEFPHCYHT